MSAEKVLSSRGGLKASHGLTAAQIAEMEALWIEGVSAAAIGIRFGVSKNTVIGHVRRRKWKRPPRPLNAPLQRQRRRRADCVEAQLTEAQLWQMRGLWDGGETAAGIAKRFGISDKTVRQLAERAEWLSRPTRAELGSPPPTTLHQRLAAIHARMDAVLAETRPFVEERKPLLLRAEAA